MTKRDDETDEGLRFEVELDAPPARVWRALTIPEYVERWLAPPDGPANDRGAPPYRLIESEPERSVRYAWREADNPGDSVVTFRIAPNNAGGTTFVIEHERMSSARSPPAPANRNALRLLLAA